MMNYNDFLVFRDAADNGFLLLFGLGILGFFLFYWLINFRFVFYAVPKLQFPSIALPWVLLIALILRLPSLMQSFWYDETFTAAIASLPLSRAFMVILSDVHPPLAYFPFWIISQVFGLAGYWLRLPSLIAGLGIVWALYRIARQWGEDCGKLAAFLGALMPALIWYSDEARAYSFLVLLVLAALIGLEEKRPILFALSIALLPLIHVYGYLYAAFLGIYALWHKIASFRVLMAAAVPALLWLPAMVLQSQDVANGFWLPAPNIGGFFKPLLEMQIGLGYPAQAAVIVIPCLIAVSFIAIVDNCKREMLPYWLCFFFVPMTAAAISWLWHPIYLPRALLPAVSMMILFYARWIVRLKPLAAAFLWISLVIVLAYQVLDHDSIRYDLASYVGACDGKPIYTMSVEVAITADFYSKAPISIYSDYNNLNQSLNAAAVSALGYQIEGIPSRGACVYWQDTPMVTENQRFQRDFIVALLNLNCERFIDSPFRRIEVCK